MMPLVLSTNEATESGIAYADVTGVESEYPCRYRKLVRPGERFVYYRGRPLPRGKTRPQQYFGTGVIDEISKSASGADRLICRILDYREFSNPVGLRWSNGTRVGPGGTAGGLSYRTGVRVITEKIVTGLLQIGIPARSRPVPRMRPPSPPTMWIHMRCTSRSRTSRRSSQGL